MTLPPSLVPLAVRILRYKGGRLPEVGMIAELGLLAAPGEYGRHPPSGGHLTRRVDAPVEHLTKLLLHPLQELTHHSLAALQGPKHQSTLCRNSLSTRLWDGRRI